MFSSDVMIDIIIRALIVGLLVSVCASLLGVSLVLKRFSMIGDGLSHVGFGAVAVAALLNLSDFEMEVSIPIVVLAAILILKLNEKSKIKGDSAIAIISTGANPNEQKFTVLLKDFYNKGKYIGAICAAPMILGQLGFLKGRKATCYPGFEKELVGADYVTSSVVTDNHIITSRGLGTAIDFSGELIGLLKNSDTAEQIKKQIIYTR